MEFKLGQKVVIVGVLENNKNHGTDYPLTLSVCEEPKCFITFTKNGEYDHRSNVSILKDYNDFIKEEGLINTNEETVKPTDEEISLRRQLSELEGKLLEADVKIANLKLELHNIIQNATPRG
jgi:hypothetical protein